MGARALERAGYEIEADRWRHGHRDLPEQREEALKRGDHEYAEAINREATKHRGPQVDAMERKGVSAAPHDFGYQNSASLPSAL
jgi:hypothetical protein